MKEIGFIDWDAAVAAGRAVVPPGPALSATEAAEAVASLRQAAVTAVEHVGGVTELAAPAPADTLVVDRPSWMKACAETAATVIGALGAPDNPWQAVLGRVRGGQAGAVLAAISTRVLGQFDPFGEPARLLLVAPNIVAVERDLRVVPADFRLWVCLHEQTHRFQFGQAPWLREHLLGLITGLLDEEDLFSWPQAASGASIVDRMLSPQARATFDQITAAMSLIEGHADVMMDRVGTDVVPTLPTIRAAFEARRDRGGWTAIVGRLLGNDLKLAQYREGAAFCRAVIDQTDVATLNAVWSGADALPTLAEVRDPDGRAWLRRVHG